MYHYLASFLRLNSKTNTHRRNIYPNQIVNFSISFHFEYLASPRNEFLMSKFCTKKFPIRYHVSVTKESSVHEEDQIQWEKHSERVNSSLDEKIPSFRLHSIFHSVKKKAVDVKLVNCHNDIYFLTG